MVLCIDSVLSDPPRHVAPRARHCATGANTQGQTLLAARLQRVVEFVFTQHTRR